MKLKYAIYILLLGYVLEILGALLKIMHHPVADILLMASTFIIILGIFLIVVKLVNHPKIKDIMNS
ncbi:MAG: hypothetical protein WKF88_10005 [Ferruginibacter sp.]